MTGAAPSGRPKDVTKRAAILAAARRLALGRGPGGLTVEAVAAAAQVSRMTVYGHFGDRESLFAAVIAAEAAEVGRALDDVRDPGRGCGTLASDLEAFGTDLLAFLLQPERRAFNRLVEAEASRHPELARSFAEQGPQSVMRGLATRLEREMAARRLAAASPLRAARHLVGLLRSIETSAMALGFEPPPDRAAIAAHVADCVAVFLRAYAPG